MSKGLNEAWLIELLSDHDQTMSVGAFDEIVEAINDHSEQLRQLAEQRAELLALAEETREWHRGDKWRDSDIPMQREAWESRRDKIDRAISNATQQRNATGGEG